MNPTVKAIRKVLAASEIEFNCWVRCWRDGEIWVGATGHGSTERMNQLVRVLEANGYRTECNGKPGTEGAFIVEVMS